MAADEYIDQAAAQEAVSDNIVIVGNDYDHKDMQRTLPLLVDALPRNHNVAIGFDGAAAPNVTVMPSGQIDPEILHRLIASARVIVFPSFYEGFGIPVVQGLAYGRPVVVRQSLLWNEIAAQSRSPGVLLEFDNSASLVEAVGCALAGLNSKQQLPQGIGRKLRADESPLRLSETVLNELLIRWKVTLCRALPMEGAGRTVWKRRSEQSDSCEFDRGEACFMRIVTLLLRRGTARCKSALDCIAISAWSANRRL